MPLLFSYGTLQQKNVQLSTFGRLLEGSRDELLGYEQSLFKIKDPGVVATSGKTHHPMATFCGNPKSRVPGTVFEITADELARADRYEVSSYKRVLGELKSGKKAWVYVDARNAPTQPQTWNEA
jgi:gamma-glutamylcyclotransferase (GGCT)/AIG2-like uncharacterized protein YtfP